MEDEVVVEVYPGVASAIATFQDDVLNPGPRQLAGGGKPRRSGAHDDDVVLGRWKLGAGR